MEQRQFYRNLLSTTALIGVLSLIAAPVKAQVVLDGTTGPGGELIGPDYEITDDLGTRAGNNLFHSFSEFSLDTNDVATFSGPDEIANVISRVTGPNPSDIDGTLRSTMPAADFYFINPNGVSFGPNATLDVQGSFHVSTADELRLEDGQVFSTVTADVPSGLMVAEPQAFGFFDAAPGEILVDGSTLEVGEGERLSLVGGDITLDGGEILAETGTVNLLSLDRIGEAGIFEGTATANKLADIKITNQSRVDTSGNGAGIIQIIGENIDLGKNSIVISDNIGDLNAIGNISIAADRLSISGNAKIRAGVTQSGSGVSILVNAGQIAMTSLGEVLVEVHGSGSGGVIKVLAESLMISDFDDGRPSGISSETISGAEGDAGEVSIDAGSVILLNQGSIRSITSGSGSSGDVIVTASSIFSNYGFIGANTFSSGDAGTVVIKTNSLVFENEGRIFNGTNGTGDGGDILVVANTLVADATLDHEPSFHTGIASTAEADSSGRAGEIYLDVISLELKNGGLISVETRNQRDAGTITIVAGDIGVSSGGLITSQTLSSGSAGSVDIDAQEISVDDGGIINSSTFDSGSGGIVNIETSHLEIRSGGQVNSLTSSSGDAGTVELATGKILIDSEGADGFTGITSQSATSADGSAGEVVINADVIDIRNIGQITSGAFGQGNAGRVSVNAKSLRIIGDGGASNVLTGIASQAEREAGGAAGEVFIEAGYLELSNNGSISSSTFGSQAAGTVQVKVGTAHIDNGRIASRSTSTEAAGDVIVTGERVNITNGEILTEGQSSEGGQIVIEGSRYLSIADSIVTSNGITPEPGASLIELNGKVIALNSSRVTSLTGDGDPVTGAGVVDVNGEFTLISTDSIVEASSSVEISGVLSDFSDQLIVLDNQFVDASRLLRESCESGGDLGGSTFVTSGQSPSILPGDGLLPGFYTSALVTARSEGNASDPVLLVVPCPEAEVD